MPNLLFQIIQNLLNGHKKEVNYELEQVIPSINEHLPVIVSSQLEELPVDSAPKPLDSIPDPRWFPELPRTEFFKITSGGTTRKIAYTISGNMDANKVLLCLPGLLETKASFTILHAYFLRFSECKVISIDFSGRGESDALSLQEQYKMSVYLSDVGQFIESLIFQKNAQPVQLTILGTSMGGVLAMYLAQRYQDQIAEIILNDIALTVNWTSLFSLYKSMHHEIGYAEVRDLARELSVDQRAIAEVQLPTHFDLSYRADVWGMNFHNVLKHYKGKVGLIYGGKSKICTQRRVKEAKISIPRLMTCEVQEAGHPAPFDLKVCEFIQDEMDIKG
jgi:pimeloyl-ACP methyl ester carboxylesterase